jgi:hypothetical protein
MLVDFEVENFRSYRKAKRFSLVASPATELSQNLIELTDLDLRLLRSAVIYGPNASGKSNLLAAMDCVSELLESPVDRGMASRIARAPFALDRASAAKPSRFRVRFLVAGILYDYSIVVGREGVEEERLAAHPHGRPQEWFHRKGTEIEFNATYLKGQKQSLRSMTPPSVPLLSVAAAFEHPQLFPPAQWLKVNLCDRFNMLGSRPRIIRPGADMFEIAARRCHQDELFRSWANAFLRHADLGIQGVETEVIEVKSGRPSYKQSPDGSTVSLVEEVTREFHHPYFVHSSDQGFTARLGLSSESQGTRRLFAMLPPLYEVLNEGQLALVDELSASLHPSLVRELIRVVHDPTLNPKGAQLVFATHETSLLSGRLFRRDQVWFTEKDAKGATDLYSLHDLRGIRDDEPFEKGYLRGRYGAIPFFGQFDFPPVAEEPAEATS